MMVASSSSAHGPVLISGSILLIYRSLIYLLKIPGKSKAL